MPACFCFPPLRSGEGKKVCLWKCEVANVIFVQIVQLMVNGSDGELHLSGDITRCWVNRRSWMLVTLWFLLSC